MKLNLGSGHRLLPGYVNVDIVDERATVKPDVQCDIRKLIFEDDSADEILSVHVIEHFYRWEVDALLKEWIRVLKPGGLMVLETPNLETACRELLKNPKEGSLPKSPQTMWVFYGDPKWKDPLMCHKWLYTPWSLGLLLHQAGLKNVRQEPSQYKAKEPRDMRIVGVK